MKTTPIETKSGDRSGPGGNASESNRPASREFQEMTDARMQQYSPLEQYEMTLALHQSARQRLRHYAEGLDEKLKRIQKITKS